MKGYERHLERFPDNAEAYDACACVFVDRQDDRRALADLNKALRRKPAHGPAWFARARARARLGEREAALEDVRQALSLRLGDSLMARAPE